MREITSYHNLKNKFKDALFIYSCAYRWINCHSSMGDEYWIECVHVQLVEDLLFTWHFYIVSAHRVPLYIGIFGDWEKRKIEKELKITVGNFSLGSVERAELRSVKVCQVLIQDFKKT